MININKTAIFVFMAALILPTVASANSYTYQISALDLPIGSAHIDIENPNANYHIGLSGEFTGIAAIFVGAKGNIAINGHQVNGSPIPTNAESRIAWGDKPRHTLVNYTDGNPTDISVDPPYNYNPKKRVPLDPATLNDTIDPLTAMLRPLDNGKLDCSVRLRLFDGHERYDLQFSPTDNPMACMVQPINISGHDRKYDENNPPRPLKIAFTPIEDGTHAIPSKIIRDLAIGKVIIELAE